MLAGAFLASGLACGPRPSPPTQVAVIDRASDQHSELSERADRGRVRPLQPPAAPDARSPVAARPAPQRTTRPPARPVQAAPAPVATSGCTGRMSRDQAHACWDGLLAAYPWPTATAFRILYCESTGNPNASNGRYHGLMQVDGASFDPALNIAAAYGFWLRRGWQPWECK